MLLVLGNDHKLPRICREDAVMIGTIGHFIRALGQRDSGGGSLLFEVARHGEMSSDARGGGVAGHWGNGWKMRIYIQIKDINLDLGCLKECDGGLVETPRE
jgi:hypothetical protein